MRHHWYAHSWAVFVGTSQQVRRSPRRRELLVCAILAASACKAPESDARNRSASRGGDVVSAPTVAFVDTIPLIVYKSPTCGCCQNWADTLRAHGFRVVAVDTSDVGAVKRALGVPDMLGSCHTGLVDDYVIEGHVPPADIRRVLSERPQIAGLAVPGMPRGSPGMEGPQHDSYHVLSFDRTGATRVYSSY